MIRRVRVFLLLAACGLFVSIPALRTQTGSALALGPQPPDVPAEWRQLLGVYRRDATTTAVILERDQKLFWLAMNDNLDARAGFPQFEVQVSDSQPPVYSVHRGEHGDSRFTISYAQGGTIAGLKIGEDFYRRTDAGADPAHFYRITPIRPLEQLRAAALAAKPPDEAGPFRKPDLVELATLDPSIRLDIRYAQSNNFLSTPVYTEARAFMQRPAAQALLRVAQKLQPLGYGLLIHDAYRPWYVSKIFWDATPPADHIFVADPQKGSRHNRGCAVDLTLYDLASRRAVEMPGLYDEMSMRSFPSFLGGTSLQRWHRDLLRTAMESEGFAVNEDEWWHFDYRDWKYYAILNVPFEKLGSANTGF